MRLGIDVGGTNLKVGAVSDHGVVLAAGAKPLGEYHGPETFADTLAALARETAERAGAAWETVSAVGVGIPGAVASGSVLYTCNIPMQRIPLGTMLQRRLSVPVSLGNDADCAAVGEYFCGAGRGCRDFVTVTLGTGIGAGMILNGRLYTGIGTAGEAGHMVTRYGGVRCGCGLRGCWEQYASATGLIRMTREAMREMPDSLLHAVAKETGGVNGRTPFLAAQRGDKTARQICARYVEQLSVGIVNLMNLLAPERIALGGGVSDAPEELLLRPLREKAEAGCYGRHAERMTELVRAELGSSAGVIGAALLDRVS